MNTDQNNYKSMLDDGLQNFTQASAPSTVSSIPVFPDNKPAPKKYKKYLFIALTIVILIAIISGMVYLFSPKKTAKASFDDLAESISGIEKAITDLNNNDFDDNNISDKSLGYQRFDIVGTNSSSSLAKNTEVKSSSSSSQKESLSFAIVQNEINEKIKDLENEFNQDQLDNDDLGF